MQSDRLAEIVLQCIESAQHDHDHNELVNEAVALYIFELMQQAHIPHPSLDKLEDYLSEDALEIFRKKLMAI